jgi:hypothetical protein
MRTHSGVRLSLRSNCVIARRLCADNYFGGYEHRDRLLFVGALIDTQCDELYSEQAEIIENASFAINSK